MSEFSDAVRRALPVLEQLPDDEYFAIYSDGELRAMTYSQEKVQEWRAFFPGVLWKRTWNKGCGWWEYACTWEGLTVKLYACEENPPQCTARYETRQVEKQIADTFHTETLEEQVLVGWDCGGHITEEGAQ